MDLGPKYENPLASQNWNIQSASLREAIEVKCGMADTDWTVYMYMYMYMYM